LVPDVLLLDIHLPGMLGSEAVRVFREKYPSLQILMLTVYDGQDKVFESNLQWRVRLSFEEDAAGEIARVHPRST
jgi:CheY-like chemotaxis protein